VTARNGRTWQARCFDRCRCFCCSVFFPGMTAWRAVQAKSALNASMAIFAERCKTAGGQIKRTVENVDGVVWIKWREEYSSRDNFADQFS
jgi:hypothetical protein